MTGPKPVGRRWTRAEEKQLQDMLDAGMTAGEAATKLGRTRQSIYARLQRLYRKRGKPARRLVETGLKAKGK
jgi:IS30 family transposase